MATTRQELKEKLMEQAQEAIGKMLAGLPKSSAITLKDMEDATGVMGQRLMQASLQGLVEVEQTVARGEQSCEHCQARLSRRGKRKKRLVTVSGEIEVERDYYLCPQCGAGFPLDKQWQFNETAYSDELGKQMVWLSGLLTYKEAARVLKRIGDVSFLPAVYGDNPSGTEVVYKRRLNDNGNKSG